MERKFGAGVGNIVRFNWHLYGLAGGVLLTLLVVIFLGPSWLLPLAVLGALLLVLSTLTSLLVSFYVYDLSGIYRLRWLLPPTQSGEQWININAGFDELSLAIHLLHPKVELRAFDFFAADRHTEVSIRRARRWSQRGGPPKIPLESVETDDLPVPDATVDRVILFFAAHEIRDFTESVNFFTEVFRILKPGGTCVVVEHLRDLPNFMAYNLGAFHFLGRGRWYQTFAEAGLLVLEEQKITPFVSCFKLQAS